MRVPARKVKDWTLVETDVVERKPGTNIFGMYRFDGEPSKVRGNFRLTPPLPEVETLAERLAEETEMVRLVPYGCTKLRISLFPYAGRKIAKPGRRQASLLQGQDFKVQKQFSGRGWACPIPGFCHVEQAPVFRVASVTNRKIAIGLNVTNFVPFTIDETNLSYQPIPDPTFGWLLPSLLGKGKITIAD